MPTYQQRIRPTEGQVMALRDLLDGVPVAHRHEWGTRAGQAFLTEVRSTVDRGVPISWLAQELGLSENQLRVVLSRYREGAA
jgi:hypothetical protein